MTNLNIYILPLLLLFNPGCVNSSQKEGVISNKQPVYTIHLEGCLKNQKQMKLSEIADTIEYIALKAPASRVIVANDVKCSKDYMFVNSGSICQFSKDGNFIREIATRGKDPGEYNIIRGYSVDEKKKEVAIVDVQQVLFYSFDGTFLRSLKYKGFSYLVQADSFYYAAGEVFGREKYVLTMLNNSLDTIRGIPNTQLYEPGEGYTFCTFIEGRDPFYTHGNRAYFKGFEDNDTIWRLEGLDYKTHAIIDMGKFKSPQQATINERMGNFQKKLGNFYFIPRVMEDKRYIYLPCSYYWNPDMKKPRVVYDKKSEAGFVTKDGSNEYGIVDDILNGPSFWPSMITEDYYISLIEPVNLLNQSNDLVNPSPAFKKFLKTIDEDKSNSILIRAKRKKL